MKAVTCCVIAFLICYADCGRKVVQPLDRHANIDFINMEAGGGVRPAAAPAKPGALPAPSAAPAKPQPPPAVTPTKPLPQPAATPSKPAAVSPPKAAVVPGPTTSAVRTPSKPAAASGPATPGPGSVQQLINYYDSQGKASPIRPYSYSQAVKKGKQ